MVNNNQIPCGPRKLAVCHSFNADFAIKIQTLSKNDWKCGPFGPKQLRVLIFLKLQDFPVIRLSCPVVLLSAVYVWARLFVYVCVRGKIDWLSKIPQAEKQLFSGCIFFLVRYFTKLFLFFITSFHFLYFISYNIFSYHIISYTWILV